MATVVVRLASSSSVFSGRRVFLGKGVQSPLLLGHRWSATSTNNDFFTRNKALSRPVSPHLSILLKNPPIHAMLSISHRITGVMLAVDISGTTLAWVASGKSFPQFVESVHAMSISPLLISGAKFGFAFPLCYHFFNAIRHLTWDMGYGFQTNDFSRTGFITLGIALLSAIGLTLYTPATL